jgi:uncharacterized protein (DUF952 family)
MVQIVYKIVSNEEWRRAEATGSFAGAAIDLADGYIHLSDADQVRRTAALHFAGSSGLLLVGVNTDKLGEALVWERSRGGALFPHLYGPLDMAAVVSVEQLPLGTDGMHIFPPEIPV